MPTPTSRRASSAAARSSRLYKKLVYEKQIAQDVSAQQQSLMLGSVFQIEATARPGHTRRGAREGDRRGARRASRDAGPTQPKSSARATRSRRASSQRPRDARRLRRRRRSAEHVQPLPRRSRTTCSRTSQRYRAVTPASVQGVRAASSSQPNARVVVHGVPGAAGARRARCRRRTAAGAAPGAGAESVNADEAWRKRAAEAGPSAAAAAAGADVVHSCRTA